MEQLFVNKNIRDYMWDHLASLLIGNTKNQSFNMYNGIGSNGKSILINLMNNVLGDYAGVLPLTIITGKRDKAGSTCSELAMMKGKRLACIQEPDGSEVINVGKMKELTGGDTIQARQLYAPSSEFKPQFNLVLCTNKLMEVKSTDEGTWRRIKVVNFESRFVYDPDPKNDKEFLRDDDLKEKMDKWYGVLLSMLAERVFKTNGSVKECSEVSMASNVYRNQQDYFANFIEDKIRASIGSSFRQTDVRSEFTEWYRANYDNNVPKSADLIQYLTTKLGKPVKRKWRDYAIVYDDEDSDDDENDVIETDL